MCWISCQAAESANDQGSWTTVATYQYGVSKQHEIGGLIAGSSYAVRAVLIDESGDGYYGTDVRKTVYTTACKRKLKQLMYLVMN